MTDNRGDDSLQIQPDQVLGQICEIAYKHYSKEKADQILARLEPILNWKFELAQPAIDLEEQVHRALFWIDRRELDSILVIDQIEWRRSFFDAKTDMARLDATKSEHVQKLEGQTILARTARRGCQEIEYDFYEWLYRNIRPFMDSHAFADFNNHLQQQIVSVVGSVYSSVLHPRLLEAVCLPCMYLLAGLDEEARKCEAELRLFTAGTPLVGIKSLRPVILAKCSISCG